MSCEIKPGNGEEAQEHEKVTKVQEKPSRVMVGKKAPDFTADAFVGGEFKKISLSDYHGKWVILCFYPGDFTFV